MHYFTDNIYSNYFLYLHENTMINMSTLLIIQCHQQMVYSKSSLPHSLHSMMTPYLLLIWLISISFIDYLLHHIPLLLLNTIINLLLNLHLLLQSFLIIITINLHLIICIIQKQFYFIISHLLLLIDNSSNKSNATFPHHFYLHRKELSECRYLFKRQMNTQNYQL